MAGNGINEANGLPPGLFRQAQEARYIDQHRDSWMHLPGANDPSIVTIARTFACAIREARPNVTLPPHIFIPWRAQPFFNEQRYIIDGSADATVALGAAAAANAEGINVVTESSGNFTTNTGTPYSGIVTVPQGKVAVVRAWAAQADDNGYFPDSNTGLPVVRFQFRINDMAQIFSSGLLGNDGDIEHPFEVSYVVPSGQTISVVALSTDTNSWHLVETFMKGYFIEVQDINDTLAGLLGEGTC